MFVIIVGIIFSVPLLLSIYVIIDEIRKIYSYDDYFATVEQFEEK